MPRVNYIGSFNDDSSFLLAANTVGGTDTNPQFDLHRKVPTYITLDLQLSYEFEKAEIGPAATNSGGAGATVTGGGARPEIGSFWGRILAGTKITVGMNDVLNQDPPTVLGAFNDSYDTSLYSLRNRFYYISLKKKF